MQLRYLKTYPHDPHDPSSLIPHHLPPWAPKASADEEGAQVLQALLALLGRVANRHVRGTGSVGGNIVMAKTRGFLSDLVTALGGAGASVTLLDALTGESSSCGLLEVPPPSCPTGTRFSCCLFA